MHDSRFIKLDLVTANAWSPNGSISVLFGDGLGSFAPPLSFAAGDTPIAVAIGDLNAGAATTALPPRTTRNCRTACNS